MDKRSRLDNLAVASLAVAWVMVIASGISASAQLAAEHERQMAGHAVTLAADGRMKLTVTGNARQADAGRQMVTTTARPRA